MQRNRCGHCCLLRVDYTSSASLFWAPSCVQMFSQLWRLKRPTENCLVGSWQYGWWWCCNTLLLLTHWVSKFLCNPQPLESKCNVGVQVRSRVCRNLLRPHHAVPAAGERRGGRHLPGGQDDQSHEARSLHWYSESSSVLSLLWRSSLFCHITTTLVVLDNKCTAGMKLFFK